MQRQPSQRLPHERIRRHSRSQWRGFTLTELLVVIAIISILAGLSMAGLQGATEQAREARTLSVISKLDQLIMEKYDSFLTRSVRVNLAAGATPYAAASARLQVIRELMRMELPDQIEDLAHSSDTRNGNDIDQVTTLDVNRAAVVSTPSVTRSYRRKIAAAASIGSWTNEFASAECLYLIISTMRDGDKSVLEFFRPEEIGDTDGDGMPEFLDGWGRPIYFVRWAPGYVNDPQGHSAVAATLQSSNANISADPFDPLHIDPRWQNPQPHHRPYALKPLIFSGGADKLYYIYIKTPGTAPNDPYIGIGGTAPSMSGDPADPSIGYGDDLTNHYQEGL